MKHFFMAVVFTHRAMRFKLESRMVPELGYIC